MSEDSKALDELAKAEEALADALNALAQASASHAMAAAFAQASGEGVELFSSELKRLDDETPGLEERLVHLQEEAKKAKDQADAAVTAFQKASTQGDRGSVEESLRDAIDARERAAVALAEHEAKITTHNKRREELSDVLAEAHSNEEQAKAKKEAAETEKAKAEAKVEGARATLSRVHRNFTKEQSKPNGVDHPLVKLFVERDAAKVQDFLSIRTRSINYDEWVREAVRSFGTDLAKQVDRAELRDALLAAGVATNIGEVTKILNRRRITDIRRELLAQAYPALLAKRLGAVDGGQAKGPLLGARVRGDLASAIAANRRRARDVRGLADIIALDLDSQAKEGVRMTFAGILAGIVVKRMGLDERTAPRAVIQAHICDSI
jgi:DNA repair exonuclease SbcCD ATPase subunit